MKGNIFLKLLFLSFFIQCSSTRNINPDDYMANGKWINNSRFRITETGFAEINRKLSKHELKEISKANAVVNVQKKLIIFFNITHTEPEADMSDFELTGCGVEREIKKVILNGSVIYESYNESDNNITCVIVYEVYRENLRGSLQDCCYDDS